MTIEVTSTGIIDSLLLVLPEYTLTLTLSLALLIDYLLGEAKRYHYLVGFGGLANQLEFRFNLDHNTGDFTIFSRYNASIGAVVWLLLILPLPSIYFIYLTDFLWCWQLLLDTVVLYLAIGLNSLHKHAMQVYRPLKTGYLDTARYYTGYLVSRVKWHS